LRDTGLGCAAIDVGRALTNELTLVIQAALTRATIGVELTFRARDAETEFTDLIIRALRVGLAISGRNRQAGSRDTLKESTRAISV
jgi:hypothetical protein